MISISEEFYTAICEGMGDYSDNVSTSYPSSEETLPWAIYECENNVPEVTTSSGETKSNIRYRVEIVGTEDIEPIAMNISDAIRQNIGMKRCFYKDANTDTYKKIIMRFEGIVDIATGAVYNA